MIKLLAGDCRDVLPTLAADSVQCVVTSPPYYGLRDYGTALWDGGDAACDHSQRRCMGATTLRLDGREHLGAYDGEKATQIGTPYRDTCGKCGAVRIDRQIGIEATPDEYLATMVAVFREVRRVLRPDGTCWVNMGDSYASSPPGNKTLGVSASSGLNGVNGASGKYRETLAAGHATKRDTSKIPGIKPKDLLMMPARLALALQANGWWLRSDIIWHKANPMPESCTDRPTSAHEHVFLLTKSARYYYDADAVRDRLADGSPVWGEASSNRPGWSGNPNVHGEKGHALPANPAGRNLRNVWTIATSPYPNAHFATYPAELAERCIRAGTSERGCCAACGKPWGRVTERAEPSYYERRKLHDFSGRKTNAASPSGNYNSISTGRAETSGVGYSSNTTTGWSPGCKCEAGDPVPCRVLDCFAGAGTTLLVADRLQRDAIGIELNVDYTRMAMDRCIADAPLFTSFPPAEDPNDARTADLFAGDAA